MRHVAHFSFLSVISFLSSSLLDPQLMLIMFYTYRSFSSGSQELLSLLIARERATSSREIKIRYDPCGFLSCCILSNTSVYNVITQWINKFWFDFEKDCPALSDMLLEWLNGMPAFLPYYFLSICFVLSLSSVIPDEVEILVANSNSPIVVGLKTRLTTQLSSPPKVFFLRHLLLYAVSGHSHS